MPYHPGRSLDWIKLGRQARHFEVMTISIQYAIDSWLISDGWSPRIALRTWRRRRCNDQCEFVPYHRVHGVTMRTENKRGSLYLATSQCKILGCMRAHAYASALDCMRLASSACRGDVKAVRKRAQACPCFYAKNSLPSSLGQSSPPQRSSHSDPSRPFFLRRTVNARRPGLACMLLQVTTVERNACMHLAS